MPYFDHNATTPLSPVAREAWLRASDEAWQNPSSPYRSAARVRNLLDNARARLGEICGQDPQRIVFNSGATESINAIFRFAASRPELKELPILVSPLEHPCVLATAEHHFPGRVRLCELDSLGRVDPAFIESSLQSGSFALVAVMAANNETGVIQPWTEISRICRQARVLFCCDAAQWVGKLPLRDFANSSAFLAASAHKFGGPKGCGFHVVPDSLSGFHGQTGGEQEQGFRAGTEDYPGIAAMLAALEEAEARAGRSDEVTARLKWRTDFENEVLRRLPGIRITGQSSDRLWNTVSLILPVGTNERWVRKLDREGFQVSTGSACSSGKEEPSQVLAALGFSAKEAKRAIRISSGWTTSQEDWPGLAAAMEAVFGELSQDRDGGGLTKVIRL